MNEIEVRKVENFYNYDYIVYPTSYINPLGKKSLLNENLKSKIAGPCHILFDLLLCNGNCFNRFYEVEFDGSQIQKRTIENVSFDRAQDVDFIENYYRQNPKALTQGVLVASEYMMHC